MKIKQIIVWLLAGLALIILPTLAFADNSLEHTGIIESVPDGGGAGMWVVGGVTFKATAATEFRAKKGPLVAGVCAEVEYDVQGTQNFAKKIASKSADDCAAEDSLEHKGLIQEMPLGGGPGSWVIGGTTFKATAATEFRPDAGPFDMGVCAEVKYAVQAAENVALRIKSKDAADCSDEDDDQKVHGIIDALPPDGLIGTWTVDGVEYKATTTTKFEQSDGPFETGACVEIEFITHNGQHIALEIETDDDCGNGTMQPEVRKASGIVDSFPAVLSGTWTIDGTEYQATTSTEFQTKHGDFAIGVCVRVKYMLNGDARTALKIETRSSPHCRHPEHEADAKATGLIESLPTISGTVSLSGTWTIGGVDYQANLQTRFDQEHGSFEIGRCVEVKYRIEGDTRTAVRIKTKRQHHCGDTEDDNEAFGLIEVLPDTGLLGTWTIGGLQYVVTETTKLEDGPFVVGLLVEVHFTVAADSSLIATKIEGKQAVDDDDKALAKAYGLLETMPGTGSLGIWTIGGVDYLTNANTKFEQDEGPFVVGACLKVRYRVEGGVNIAAKIETESPDDCPSDGSLPVNRLFGYVERMPTDGFVGTWVIGGLNFEINAATELKEEHGVLAVGAYVKIEYVVEDGLRVAREIKTHVPPKAGKINAIGSLQFGLSRQAGGETSQVWYINGQPYMIIDATLLDDSRADLKAGQIVQVNAFDQMGTAVATQVTALGQGNIIFLPIILR